MPGLIPLMLGSGGGRSSFISPHALPPRHSSLDATYTTQTTRPGSPGSPRSPRSPRQLSYSPPVKVPVLPQTHDEWKQEIAEVKRLYNGKRWRVCSAKCNKILDNIKNTSNIEPLFLIYLHLYAAMSMEICARPLSPSSPFRASLLQQAQSHMRSATSLITTAEESVVRKIRPASVNSSWGSSCHSPADSVSSRAWTPDTQISTPTTSVYSLEDLKGRSSAPVKRGKKVSFSIPREEQQPIQISEPHIRGDSPTLGFDDDFFSPSPSSQHDVADLSKSQFQEVELPLQPMSEEERFALEEDAFLAARSLDRYCDLLSSLRLQLSKHSAFLNEMLSESAVQQTTRSLDTSSMGDEMRTLDRQARIERLRKVSFQRKRFDPTRYQDLCDNVMMEIS